MSSQLPSPGDLYSQAMGQIQGYGNAEQANLTQSYMNAMGIGMQSLASSGLAGTSVAPSMRMGYMKQYQQSLNALGQSLNQQKLGAESTFGLGGIQAQQAQQGLDISKQNLALNQKYFGLAEKQQGLQAQAQSFDQGFRQNAYSQSLGQQNGTIGQNMLNDWYTQAANIQQQGFANFRGY